MILLLLQCLGQELKRSLSFTYRGNSSHTRVNQELTDFGIAQKCCFVQSSFGGLALITILNKSMPFRAKLCRSGMAQAALEERSNTVQTAAASLICSCGDEAHSLKNTADDFRVVAQNSFLQHFAGNSREKILQLYWRGGMNAEQLVPLLLLLIFWLLQMRLKPREANRRQYLQTWSLQKNKRIRMHVPRIARRHNLVDRRQSLLFN